MTTTGPVTKVRVVTNSGRVYIFETLPAPERFRMLRQPQQVGEEDLIFEKAILLDDSLARATRIASLAEISPGMRLRILNELPTKNGTPFVTTTRIITVEKR